MTTAIPLDDDGRVWLYTSGEALARIGHKMPYSVLFRWARDGHVTPTRPAAGTGSEIGWSPHDVNILEAIGRVRHDLDLIGLPCTPKLVRELWDQLDCADSAVIAPGHGHVTIIVHLQPDTT